MQLRRVVDCRKPLNPGCSDVFSNMSKGICRTRQIQIVPAKSCYDHGNIFLYPMKTNSLDHKMHESTIGSVCSIIRSSNPTQRAVHLLGHHRVKLYIVSQMSGVLFSLAHSCRTQHYLLQESLTAITTFFCCLWSRYNFLVLLKLCVQSSLNCIACPRNSIVFSVSTFLASGFEANWQDSSQLVS